MFWINFKKL